MDGLRYSPDDPITDLGLSILRVFMFEHVKW